MVTRMSGSAGAPDPSVYYRPYAGQPTLAEIGPKGSRRGLCARRRESYAVPIDTFTTGLVSAELRNGTVLQNQTLLALMPSTGWLETERGRL